jgi:hypothetical protein
VANCRGRSRSYIADRNNHRRRTLSGQGGTQTMKPNRLRDPGVRPTRLSPIHNRTHVVCPKNGHHPRHRPTLSQTPHMPIAPSGKCVRSIINNRKNATSPTSDSKPFSGNYRGEKPIEKFANPHLDRI